MKWWTTWLLVVGLLSAGDFHRSKKMIVSALMKDRNPVGLGHSRSLKHNSIANYYRDLHRPAAQKCTDPELTQRVRDAAAIFTGTVQYMVDDGSRGDTAIVDLKRVVKGDEIMDRFTSSSDQFNHRTPHHRRRRRSDQLNHRAPHHRRQQRMVAVTGLGERCKGSAVDQCDDGISRERWEGS